MPRFHASTFVHHAPWTLDNLAQSMTPAEVKPFTSLGVSMEALLELASEFGFGGSSVDPAAPGWLVVCRGPFDDLTFGKLARKRSSFPKTEY